MADEWHKDSRTICKYGIKCYQKNSEHHKNYKHPPQMAKQNFRDQTPISKRFKPSPRNAAASPRDVEDPSRDPCVGTSPKNRTPRKNPSPRKFTSPKNNTDLKHETSDGAVDPKNENIKNKAAENEDYETNTIKLPEQIIYHEKDGAHKAFKECFLVDMPPDFFKFYECLNEDTEFEKTLASVNLQLIGPYDLLMGKLPVLDDKELYLIHWRFFYDPPEFQAVLKRKGKSQFHIGYFRDEPEGSPVFLASNDCAKDCLITPIAENIFGAVYLYLQKEKNGSPFSSIACQRLMDKVKKWASLHNYSLEEFNMKKRLLQTVTKTFHSAGIVVPYNKKTQLGYRRLVETDVNLRKLFAKLEAVKSQSEKDKILSEIQPVITYANIAVDECDFGTGLEVGIALFCSGLKELQPSALGSLCSAYSLLNRGAFGQIIQAHLKYRRKGPDMSVLSVSEK